MLIKISIFSSPFSYVPQGKTRIAITNSAPRRTLSENAPQKYKK